MHFRQRQVSQLKAEEGQAIEGAQFIAFRGAQTLAQADLLILTREDFFEFAREVKHRTSEMRILGEIHSPLAYLNPQMDRHWKRLMQCVSVRQKLQKHFKSAMTIRMSFRCM